MLNVNAKSFVPQSNVNHAVSYGEIFYRYVLTIPNCRECDLTEDLEDTSGLYKLLTRRLLCSYSVGGPGDDALQHFTTTFFSNARNSRCFPNGDAPTGLLLSRSIISLSGALADVGAVSTAPGFIIRVNVPTYHGAEVSVQLKTAWDDFLCSVRDNPRIIALGYVGFCSGVSLKRRYTGTYCHYFFASTVVLQQKDVLLCRRSLLELPSRPLRVIEVNAVAQFACKPQIPVVVVISVGEESRRRLLSDGKPDQTFSVFLCPYDVSWTLSRLGEYEVQFLNFLKEQQNWSRTVVVHVDITFDFSRRVGTLAVPIYDVIGFMQRLCDDTASKVLGVCLSKASLGEGCGTLTNGEIGAKVFDSTLKQVLSTSCLLDAVTAPFGCVPQHIRGPMTFAQYEYAHRMAETWLPTCREPARLNRVDFATSANDFANYRYYVRHRVVGTKVLVIIGERGDASCVDVGTGSLYALPESCQGIRHGLKNSIFSAMVASSCRGYMEYLIIVEDVLVFEGTDVHEDPFLQRWSYVEKCLPYNNASHAHASHYCVAIVRSLYAVSAQVEKLLASPPTEYPTLGLVFVPHSVDCKYEFSPVYSWTPTSSLTALFLVGRVDDVPSTNGVVSRACLYVVEDENSNSTTSYNNEYVDYLSDDAPGVCSGSMISCVLRRGECGSHWWELLKLHGGSPAVSPDVFDVVDKLVHLPGVTYQEMLWLLGASKYKCERCHAVSDAGRVCTQYATYWCRKCWEETGHGDCVYCSRSCVMGKVDSLSQRFYCDNCWAAFSTTNLQAEVGYCAPATPDAFFATQVVTRCASLLIDILNTNSPTNDVLELCCGELLIPKWIKNKTVHYIGVDIKSSVVDKANRLVSSMRREATEMLCYDILCANVFSVDFWNNHLPAIHPRPFHVVAAFTGFHHAFRSESVARQVIANIAAALIPGGVFICCFFDAETLFVKDEYDNINNITVEWGSDFQPRVGHHFFLSMWDGSSKKINVIPVDFFVAVGIELGLTVVSEGCLTFHEILENDHNFIKLISSSEREYLYAMRAITFRKEGHPQMHASLNPSGDSNENK